MCHMCRALTADADRPGVAEAVTAGAAPRELLAALLTVKDGACPLDLVANTLDEEPCDGSLGSRPAHYAWRERLWRADEQLRSHASGAEARSGRGMWRRPDRGERAAALVLDRPALALVSRPC